MATYSKFCCICGEEFITGKISTLFCSKKCRNASRSMPTAVLKKVMARNSRWVMMAVKDPVRVMDKERFVGYTPNGATKENPLGEDEAYVIARARELAVKRGIKVPSGTSLKEIEEKIKEKRILDVEDVGHLLNKKNLKQEVEDNLKYINLEDPINGDSSGFGMKPKSEENKTVPTVHTGIRKLSDV